MKSSRQTFKGLATAGALMAIATFASLVSAQSPTNTVKPYPLTTCLVSDGKLGEMGKPYVFTNDSREIKLCCKGCLNDFNKNQAKYLKKLEEAQKKK